MNWSIDFGNESAMTKSPKAVYATTIGVVILVVLVLLGRDTPLKRHTYVECGDGPRRAIDLRDFTTRYSAYTLELEASISDKRKLSTKLNPVQLQRLSEAMQSALEFCKYAVARYNTCAVTKEQYGQYGARLQTLDGLAVEIDDLVSKSALKQEDEARLEVLIGEYSEMARELALK